MTHGPDYTLSYIEQTIQSLSIRGLTITPQDVLTGIWKLNAAGIEGRDAEATLHSFLASLSPFGARDSWGAFPTFPGWEAIAEDLKPHTLRDLSSRFGSDAMRVASVARG